MFDTKIIKHVQLKLNRLKTLSTRMLKLSYSLEKKKSKERGCRVLNLQLKKGCDVIYKISSTLL